LAGQSGQTGQTSFDHQDNNGQSGQTGQSGQISLTTVAVIHTCSASSSFLEIYSAYFLDSQTRLARIPLAFYTATESSQAVLIFVQA